MGIIMCFPTRIQGRSTRFENTRIVLRRRLGFIPATVYGQTMNDPVLQNPVRASTRLQLVASLEQTSVKIGDPIKLHFRLKNVSQATLPSALTASIRTTG